MTKSLKPSLIVGAIALGALLPAAASAAPNVSPTDVRNAAQQCRVERGTTAESRDAFRVKYGSNANGRNAFGRCVAAKAKANAQARQAARRACLTERGDTAESVAAFQLKYGTDNPLKACVAARLAS